MFAKARYNSGMKILIFGAGVMGSVYAAKLAQSGESVTILARGKRLRQLKQNGIILKHFYSDKQTTTHVNVVKTLNPNDAYDVIAVHVRRTQLESALPLLARNKKTPTILVMVNNATGVKNLANKIDKERLVLGFPCAGGGMEKDGKVVYAIAPGFSQKTTIGELNGSETYRVKTLVEMYRKAGFPAAVSTNIQAWLKTHLVFILPICAALLKYKGDNHALANDDSLLTHVVKGFKEGLNVLKTLRIPITPSRVNIFFGLPSPLLFLFIKLWIGSGDGEVFFSYHVRASADENYFLIDEFTKLIEQSKVDTPSLNKLFSR